ncbi:MAG: hypothetical protein Q9191_005678 [Dirinaria sp. TL-2023a]
MDTAYHPVSGKPEVQTYTTSVAESPRPTKNRRRWPLSVHVLSHVFGILWLVPIILLLVLNFKQHIIGASVWCPVGKCNADSYGDASNAIARANRLDKEDHNILGALQFVAKALEVWFMFIATALLYDVALCLAKQRGGLPIGYLFTHLEFGDIRNLVNPLMWTSPLPHGNLLPAHRPSGTWKLYLFATLAAFLTILTNLMGPGTAVLVLPTLRWMDTKQEPTQRFNSYNAFDTPSAAALTGCNVTQLSGRNYTCTQAVYGPSMDSWAAQVEAMLAQAYGTNGEISFSTSPEGSVSFTANLTSSGELFWMPTRQVLRDLSADLFDLGNLVLPGEYSESNLTKSYTGGKRPAYNNSLETILQREGPSVGAQANCALGNITTKILGPEKQVRCFDNYTVSENSSYTKCYKVGQGWGGSNEVAQFYLGDATSASNESLVWVYTSDKATFFNQTTDFGSGIEKCLDDDSAPCDWDQIFDTALDPELRNTSVNPLVTEYFSPLYAVGQFVDIRLYCDAIVYSSFPTYSVDTSATANPLHLANMNGLPTEDDKHFNATPLAVNPDWVLAAWSVANNGTVDSSRLIGREMARVVGSNYDLTTSFGDDPIPEDTEEFAFLHIYSITQSLSLIDYDYTNDTTPFTSKSLNQAQPVFKKWATLRVWAYGLSDRTPKLGVVVSILGCLCVLARLGLALALRIRHEHSTVELFVAALEHHPTHEFDNLDDEAKMAKVRYILDDASGKPRFISERVNSGNLGGP